MNLKSGKAFSKHNFNKKRIVLALFSLLIINHFIIAGNSFYNDKTKKFNEQEAIDSIYDLCLQTSSLIKYGKGPVLDRNPTEAEILSYGEGHCGMYAYLLAKQLSMRGIESRTIDIRRYDGAAHSVVEVDLGGKIYTFDPTVGIFYCAEVKELLDNPDFESLKVGEPLRLPQYASPTFWSGVRQLVYYNDVRDFYDYDLISNDTCTVYGNISLPPLGVTTVYQENELPFIQVKFDEPQSFYRFKIYWESLPETPLAICIETAGTDGSFQSLFDGTVEAENICFSYTLSSKISAQSVRISFPDTVPEIAQLHIFE